VWAIRRTPRIVPFVVLAVWPVIYYWLILLVPELLPDLGTWQDKLWNGRFLPFFYFGVFYYCVLNVPWIKGNLFRPEPINDIIIFYSNTEIIGNIDTRLNSNDIISCLRKTSGTWPLNTLGGFLLTRQGRSSIMFPITEGRMPSGGSDFLCIFYFLNIYYSNFVLKNGNNLSPFRLFFT